MEKRVLQDVDGKDSSKRKSGTKLLNIAIGMAILHFIVGLTCSIFSIKFDYEFPLEIWWTFMGSGSGLLGITLVERFSTKSK